MGQKEGGKLMDELVKRLRCLKYGNCPDCPMWYSEEVEPNLWRERCAAIDAADAIEELSAYVQQLDELREDGWYLQKTKMMTYGQATMTMPLPEPPEEE